MTDKSSTVRQHYRPVVQNKRPRVRNNFNPKFSPKSKRNRFTLPPKKDDTEEKDES
jgi:hypothetical protein